VAVTDKLPGGGAGVGKSQMVANVVETRLENLEHLLSGDTPALESAFIDAAKLAFQQAVVIAQLLLFDQTQGVVGVLAPRLGTMHTRTVVAPLEVFRGAENGDAEAAADANAGTCITSHR